MGSPLGLLLADIFLGYLETFVLKPSNHRPSHYYRFVDDTFAIFSSAQSVQPFLNSLNAFHPSITFTC